MTRPVDHLVLPFRLPWILQYMYRSWTDSVCESSTTAADHRVTTVEAHIHTSTDVESADVSVDMYLTPDLQVCLIL